MSSSLIRQDIVPMVVGYTLIMGGLAIGLRIVQRSGKAGDPAGGAEPARAGKAAKADRSARADEAARADTAATAGHTTGAAAPPGPVTRRARMRALARPDPGWRRLAIFSLGTAVGGYLLLMAVIIGYYFGISPVAGNFVHSAFSGCAMLIGLAAPVFVALSWLAERKGWRI